MDHWTEKKMKEMQKRLYSSDMSDSLSYACSGFDATQKDVHLPDNVITAKEARDLTNEAWSMRGFLESAYRRIKAEAWRGQRTAKISVPYHIYSLSDFKTTLVNQGYTVSQCEIGTDYVVIEW